MYIYYAFYACIYIYMYILKAINKNIALTAFINLYQNLTFCSLIYKII